MLEVLVAVITLATLAAQLRRLPLQNVLSIAIIIAVGSSALEILNIWLKYPLGKPVWVRYSQKPLLELPWLVPLLWISFLLNARELARWLLRHRCETPNYGLWLMGIASFGAALFWFVMECFERKEVTWQQAGLLLGRWLFSAILLFVLVPWLIRKKPRELAHR